MLTVVLLILPLFLCTLFAARRACEFSKPDKSCTADVSGVSGVSGVLSASGGAPEKEPARRRSAYAASSVANPSRSNRLLLTILTAIEGQVARFAPCFGFPG